MRTSPRKARLVVEHIRGRSVPEARTVLAFTTRAAARDVEKVLRSAIANAEANHGLVGDDLYVSAAYVDEGPTLKRWRARARGRAARIHKHTCHITVKLAPLDVDAKPARPQAKPAEAETQRREAGTQAAGDEGQGCKDNGREADHQPTQEDRADREERGGRQLMGQKVHPGGLRVGIIHDWKSNWYTSNKEFAGALLEDVKIREHIYGKLSHAGLSDILIRKDKQRVIIDVYTARPGIVIGKSGVEVDALRREIHGMTQKNVQININEIKRPELDAKLVAQSIAEQLENRVSFRRAMKRSLASAMRSGAHGVKVQCGGRLGGTEMSRSEKYSEGRVPLHTLRADIDYGFAEAKTTFGRIGVKVWINKGEIMPEGYEGATGDREVRLSEQDQARRRGTPPAGLGQREGRRGPDREGLGPVRRRRPERGRGRKRREEPEASTEAVEETTEPTAEAEPTAGRPQPVAEAESVVEEAPAEATRERRRGRRGGLRVMLMPRKTKFRKQHRGRRRGTSKGQLTVQYGDYGLKSLDAGWVTNREIEAARIAMTRKIKRGGKVWINVFPDKPFTKKPAETRMGSGKGSPGGLGGGRQAGSRDVRARRSARGPRPRGAAPRREQAVRPNEDRQAGR